MEMLDQIQPYIVTVVQALLGLLVAAVLGWVAVMRGRLDEWLKARTTAAQRETFHKLAGEAAALVEVTYKDEGGPAKLSAAYDYVSKGLGTIGIEMAGNEIRAAIEKAVADYNAAKGAASGGQQVQ